MRQNSPPGNGGQSSSPTESPRSRGSPARLRVADTWGSAGQTRQTASHSKPGRTPIEGVVTHGAGGAGARLGRAPSPQPPDRRGRLIRRARCAVGACDRQDGWPDAPLRLRNDVSPWTTAQSQTPSLLLAVSCRGCPAAGCGGRLPTAPGSRDPSLVPDRFFRHHRTSSAACRRSNRNRSVAL